MKDNQLGTFGMPRDGCDHFCAFNFGRPYGYLPVINDEEDAFQGYLFPDLARQPVHFDRGTFDGAVLLAATFDNRVFHPFFSNLHFAGRPAPIIYA
jgi:hypothetical protein